MDGWSKTMIDHYCLCRDKDTVSWDRHWPSMRQLCAGMVSPAALLDVSFSSHDNEVA